MLITVPTTNVSAQNGTLEAMTGIVTLYAKDPLAQTFCFKDRKYGTPRLALGVQNPCSDIGFNTHLTNLHNSFSVGIEGARQGRIINLGTADELQQKYEYKELVGKDEIFASIQTQKGKIFILKEEKNPNPNDLQEITEANLLFKQTGDFNNITVKLGNVYIMRLKDGYDKNFEKIIKFVVTDYQTDNFVTIRWQIILDSEDNNDGK